MRDIARLLLERESLGSKSRTRILGGAIKIDVSIDRATGRKYRRIIVGRRPVLGINGVEKSPEGKPIRGRHVHFYGLRKEYVVFLNGKRPLFSVKESRALRRQKQRKRDRKRKS